MRAVTGVLALLVALVLGVSTASGQTTAVCSNTPVSAQRIECTQDTDSTDDIVINLESGVNITTTDESDHGIIGHHQGAGDITINVTGTEDNKTITTEGGAAKGVFARSQGKGSIDLTVTNVDITTTHAATAGDADGISARQFFTDNTHAPYDGTYNVKIRVSDSQINTAARDGGGIDGYHDGSSLNSILNTGNLEITTNNTDITTTGDSAHGIQAYALNTVGDVMITMTGGFIMTEGPYAHGIRGRNGSDSRTGQSGDLTIHVTDAAIRTTYDGSVPAPGTTDAYGIGAYNRVDGQGDVTVTLVNTDISTMGPLAARGVLAYRKNGDGNVIVTIRGGQITTNHYQAHGILGWHEGTTGDVRIDLQGVTIETNGEQLVPSQSYTLGHGAFALSSSQDGDIMIDARAGTAISTKGAFSYGLRAYSAGEGDIRITTHDGSSITNTGPSAHGIDARNVSINVMDDTRSIAITVGGDITTSGENAHGVRIGTGSGGFVGLDEDGYRRQTVTVNGQVIGGSGSGAGVYLSNGGKVVIGPQGSIRADSGIAILATGTVPEDNTDPNNVIPAIQPKLRVDMNLGGRRVAQAIGDDWILNDGGETTVAVNNVVLHEGATGVVEGAVARNGAWNVRMREEGVTVDRTDPANWTTETATTAADRDFSAQDFNERRRPTPPPPPPALEPSEHRVNERVFVGSGEAAGLLLEAGGAVYIGPEGSVGAESGIAILATGDAPDLLVDLTLEGRRVADVIGDDWIINDGGETTIVVNDVKLHDGTDGVVSDAVAPNGAWNVRIREDGVTVTDYRDPDPANWTVTDPAAGVIADRDFSTEDFIEDPAGEPDQPVFMEEYAPRAAVYEALPDFLLRLTGPGPNRKCRTAPEERVWVRFAGGQGSYEADRTTTGASYDLERFETEGGFSANFNDKVRGWASVRHVWGSADAMSPTGGGAIDVRGLGSSVGGAWRSETGAYAMGCFSYMTYNVDMASRQAGLLRAGVDSRAYTLDFEAGLPFALTEQVQMTPRVWVVSSQVSVDSFTDTVEARVSFGDADRITGGLGFLADTTRPWGEGEFILRGSVDLERLLSGTETRVQVSGERLSAVATDSSLLVGLNGIYRQGRFSIGAEVAARQELGSNDSEYASFLNLGISF